MTDNQIDLNQNDLNQNDLTPEQLLSERLQAIQSEALSAVSNYAGARSRMAKEALANRISEVGTWGKEKYQALKNRIANFGKNPKVRLAAKVGMGAIAVATAPISVPALAAIGVQHIGSRYKEKQSQKRSFEIGKYAASQIFELEYRLIELKGNPKSKDDPALKSQIEDLEQRIKELDSIQLSSLKAKADQVKNPNRTWLDKLRGSRKQNDSGTTQFGEEEEANSDDALN